MSPEPRLSVLIAWANRDELARTLAANAAWVVAHGAELIVVDCGGDEGRCARVLAGLELHAGLGPALARCLTLVTVPTRTFNKALALNLGAAVARAPALMVLDADVSLDAACVPELLAALDAGHFVTIERVRESQPVNDPIGPGALASMAHVVEFVTASAQVIRVETNRRQFADGSRGGPGLISLRREHFEAVDGMNSDLVGWGWEDVDLVARLQLSETAGRCALGSALHASHGDELRAVGPGGRARSEQSNFAVCIANYRLGYFRGTFRDDMQTCAELIERRSDWEGEAWAMEVQP